jgi:methionyl-tRNA formyltransferase
MKIGLLTDEKSWIYSYILKLKSEIQNFKNIECVLYTNHEQIESCDLVFILGYLRIIPYEIIRLNKYNLVIHESDLPYGKGYSPMAWQILDGKDEITFTLFNADKDIDSGDIFLKKKLSLTGNELYHEWREKQANLSQEMVFDILKNYPKINGNPQKKGGSFYRQRKHSDDEIDINKPFVEFINKLRICDPEKFPSWFTYKDRKFYIRISPF